MNHLSPASLIFLAALGGTLVVSEGIASACSAPVCFGATSELLPLRGKTIPSNAPGILVFSARVGSTQDPATTFTKSTPGGPETVAFTRERAAGRPDLFIPTEGFEVGASYEVTVASTCESEEPPTTTQFTVGSAAAKPTTLGTLQRTDGGVKPLRVAAGAQCSVQISAAQVSFEVALSAEAKPWEALLQYETIVDGKLWRASSDAGMQVHPAGSWKGLGKDLVYVSCEANGSLGLAQGQHQAVVRATLPGNPAVTLESTPLVFDLNCGSPTPPTTPDSGPVAPPSATVPGATPSSPSETSTPSTSSGCSAAASEGSKGSLVVAGIGVAAFVVARRRRRQA
jgi:MYXO-CTERM domain-containing protein